MHNTKRGTLVSGKKRYQVQALFKFDGNPITITNSCASDHVRSHWRERNEAVDEISLDVYARGHDSLTKGGTGTGVRIRSRLWLPHDTSTRSAVLSVDHFHFRDQNFSTGQLRVLIENRGEKWVLSYIGVQYAIRVAR